jgi:putative transposase
LEKLKKSAECKVSKPHSAMLGWAAGEGQSLNSTLRRGWYWGSVAFRETLLGLAAGPLQRMMNRNQRSSRQAHDHAEARALDLIRNGLKELGLTEQELKISRGSDARKVSLAWAIARSTTANQGWIANRLHMSSAANVTQQIRRFSPFSPLS